MQILKPTIFGSFPVFYSKIYMKIKESLSNQPPFLQSIMSHIIQSKIWYYLKFGYLLEYIRDNVLLKIKTGDE
jgi:long-subunit acyl-CoA synthetase (AMP-forming)